MDRKVKKVLASVSIIALILLLGLVSFGSRGITGAFVADAEVGSEIKNAFDTGKDEVSVIVVLKESPSETVEENQQEVLAELNLEERKTILGREEQEFELEHQYETLNAFAGEVTEDGLDKLRNDPNVESIVVNKERQLFLVGSVPVITADKVWNVVVNGKNITGSGETICVVDTGVDYNHADLGAGLGNKVIAGFDYYNNDADPMDDQGHGTHVAGIIASGNSVYKGVAPGANIAAVKVCSSSGSCPDADVLAGIDWCITNKDTYNISVISISLGGGQYTSYCDNDPDFASYAGAIDTAVQENIAVVAATGNSGAGNVAGPACVQNSMRVTATTKADVFPSYASRHAFFTDIIAAPGSAITSLNDGGGTTTMSGTSMATPHASGAAALVKQYWRLAYGKEPTPEQIEKKLLATGLDLYDSSTGVYYPRLNIEAALQPIITFTEAPQNNSMLNSSSVTFMISSDVDLVSAAVQRTFDNTVVSESMAQINATAYSITLSNLSKGTHSYQVYGTDAGGMTGISALRWFTVDNIAPVVTLLAPAAYANLSGEMVTFSSQIEELGSLSVVEFHLVQGNNSVQLPAVQNNSTWTKEVNLSEFSEGLYSVSVYALDIMGNENESAAIPFTLDQTAPNVTLLNSSFTTTNSMPAVEFQVADGYSSTIDCSLLVNGTPSSAVLTLLSNASHALQTNNSLTVGSYLVQVQCDDASGNNGVSESITVEITAALPDTYLNVQITAPVNGGIYKNETVTFTTAITGNENISSVLLNITNASQNVIVSPLQANSSWSANLNMAALAEGSHSARVVARDAQGKINDTVSLSFTVDRTAPVLSGMSESNIGHDSVQIQWTTDEAATNKVNYGTVADSLSSEQNPSGTGFSHSISLIGLTASTAYYYKVNSCDQVMNCNTSEARSFTTTVAPEEPEEDADDSGDSSDSSSSGSSSGGSGSGSSSSGSSSSSAEEFLDTEEEAVEILEESELQTASEDAGEESEVVEEVAEDQQTAEETLPVADEQDNTGFGLITGFVGAAVFGELTSKEYLLVGLTALTVVLTIVFIVIRKKERVY